MYMTEKALKLSMDQIYQRKLKLKKLSSLDYSVKNENLVRREFSSNLWAGFDSKNIEQWITRWKDKGLLPEQHWATKYGFSQLFIEFDHTFERLKRIYSLRTLKSKFFFWYFDYFFPHCGR